MRLITIQKFYELCISFRVYPVGSLVQYKGDVNPVCGVVTRFTKVRMSKGKTFSYRVFWPDIGFTDWWLYHFNLMLVSSTL